VRARNRNRSCVVGHPGYRVTLRRTCRTGESEPTGEEGGRTRGSPLSMKGFSSQQKSAPWRNRFRSRHCFTDAPRSVHPTRPATRAAIYPFVPDPSSFASGTHMLSSGCASAHLQGGPTSGARDTLALLTPAKGRSGPTHRRTRRSICWRCRRRRRRRRRCHRLIGVARRHRGLETPGTPGMVVRRTSFGSSGTSSPRGSAPVPPRCRHADDHVGRCRCAGRRSP